MPNQLDGSGLQIKTVAEIKSTIISGLQSIYGADINMDSNTPDGQLVGIFSQAAIDNLELLEQVYNSFSVDNAFGVLLDQRVSLNGLSRKPGTFTFTLVDVVVDRALTLVGLDGQVDVDVPTGDIYTVMDDAGNKFYLETTEVISGAGTSSLSFRAANRGAVLTTANTIDNQVTVTLGVVSVNNPTTATSVGTDEESDVALKIRHAASFNLAATGPSDAIAAAVLSVTDVTDAVVVENDTGGEVGGTDAHSIWTIVEGGSDADIGQAIYSKKVPGCGQRGDTSVTIARPDGTSFIAKFDRPILENLHIRFTIAPAVVGVSFDTDAIKTALAAALSYRLLQSATMGQIVLAMLAIAPQGMLETVGVSSNGTDWYDIIAPTSNQHKFVADASRITVTV